MPESQGEPVDKMANSQGNDDALALALEFHRTYELLAPKYNYKTQLATRVFDPDSANGRLMIEVCAVILARRNNPRLTRIQDK
jgi:hypothetical protein